MKVTKNNMGSKQELHLSKGEFVLTENAWDVNTPWKFVVSLNKPDSELCTAAFCVVTYKQQLLLVQNKHRDWELPGGHIDEGEELEKALMREALEESGAVIEDLTMFGYKVVLPSFPIPHRDKPGQSYPFPRSYVPYFYTNVDEVLNTELAPDIKDRKLVGFAEAKRMLAPGHSHDKIIEYLVNSGLINIHS